MIFKETLLPLNNWYLNFEFKIVVFSYITPRRHACCYRIAVFIYCLKQSVVSFNYLLSLYFLLHERFLQTLF